MNRLTYIFRKPHKGRLAASQLLLLSLAIQAHAQDGIDELDPIVVIGNTMSAEDGFDAIGAGKLAGSYDVITRDELIYEHPDDTLELFSKVPGVTLSRYNQGIINTDISIRGFAGDGVTPHSKLLIDGIPSNLHNGYNELDQMFPMAIGGIETFKGTSDLRYGLYNIAGNHNVSSRTDLAREIQLTYGSYDAIEAQGYWGLQTGKLTHNYFLGYRQANGYRDHTDLEKSAFSGRWFYEFDDTTSLGFVARFSSYEGDSPGYLSKEEARRNPRSSADFANQDGGEKSTEHLSLHFDKILLDGDLTLSAKAYYQTFERERWVRFSEAGSITNRFDDQEMTGFITTANWAINDQWSIRAGFDYEHQDVIEQRFGTIGQSRQRDTANVGRDRRYDLDVIGGYLGVENNPTDWLRWNVGVRLDHLDGDFKDFRPATPAPADIFDFGLIVQPKANIFVSLNDDVTTFLNFGRSFQHPFGASLFTPVRDVSLNDGWEIGAKWQADDGLLFRASYWQQLAKDEFISIDGTNRNVGETDRQGIDLAFNWDICDETTLWGNYSHVDAEIKNGSNRGNSLRSIPDYTYSVGLSHQFTDRLTARVHIDGQGSYHVNEANQGSTFGSYTLVNAGLDYEADWGRLSLQVNNLLDRDYEYVFDFSDDGTNTIHSPGDGVNASLSYTYEF